ncbi:MAG: type II toxin-antitoxin system VapC family toxin [Beijerinckiaceae bacterium]|nr:type II toxin-antitoxin system VapC family toxin [Beijerinckiaceae bacterium]
MFCIDTNVAIAVMNARSPSVRSRLREALLTGTPVFCPAIVLFELKYGIAKSMRAAVNAEALERFLAGNIDIIPFDEADAAHAGDIRAHLERQGTPIGPYDLLIAAQARARDATLVTANTREFERVPGLKLNDWS